MTSAVPGWGWLSPPPGPDAAPEQATLAIAGVGCHIVAARVRGKRHRHVGQYCDDWFEVATAGRWTCLAVADGAGSRALSRVGARIACHVATEYLAARLGDLSSDCPDGDDGALRDLIAAATAAAREAVIAAARTRRDSAVQSGQGGRPAEPIDFASTLLLAVYRPGLVAALQVGDGVILSGGAGGAVRVLGTPAKGEYAGETEFLVTFRGPLGGQVVVDRGPIRVLIVATDGVADDYFPPEAGGRRLLTDLILNGVLPPEAPVDPKSVNHARVERIAGPGGDRPIAIRYLEAYAEAIGESVDDLLSAADRVAEGRPADTTAPVVRLLDWLEGYTVRGSFDDRTLVALIVEEA